MEGDKFCPVVEWLLDGYFIWTEKRGSVVVVAPESELGKKRGGMVLFSFLNDLNTETNKLFETLDTY